MFQLRIAESCWPEGSDWIELHGLLIFAEIAVKCFDKWLIGWLPFMLVSCAGKT